MFVAVMSGCCDVLSQPKHSHAVWYFFLSIYWQQLVFIGVCAYDEGTAVLHWLSSGRNALVTYRFVNGCCVALLMACSRIICRHLLCWPIHTAAAAAAAADPPINSVLWWTLIANPTQINFRRYGSVVAPPSTSTKLSSQVIESAQERLLITTPSSGLRS